MSMKKSVMLSDHTVAIMQSMTDKRDQGSKIAWSNLINRSLVVNDYLARVSLPDLTDDEWTVILNAYAGCVGSIENPPFRVASDLMDDQGLVDVEQHSNPDLVKRIHSMSQSEQFAILVFVEKFWFGNWDSLANFGGFKPYVE